MSRARHCRGRSNVWSRVRVRTSLSKGEPLVDVMQRLNEVLLDLKEPAMYVTFACLRSAGGTGWSIRWRDTRQFSTITLGPERLGIKNGAIAHRHISCREFPKRNDTIAPGDLLAVVSDGFLEVTNAKGEEFGMEALERLVAGSAKEPLPQICRSARRGDSSLRKPAGRPNDTSGQGSWACDFLTLPEHLEEDPTVSPFALCRTSSELFHGPAGLAAGRQPLRPGSILYEIESQR